MSMRVVLQNRLLSLMLLAACAGCNSAGPNQASAKIPLAVSIQPQIYFVERIGGERVEVQSLLAPGQSHGAFDPAPSQVAALARSKAFFRIGVSYETPLIERLRDLAPGVEIIDTRDGIELLHMDGHSCTHDHADADEHEDADGHAHDRHADHVCGEGTLDPHIWLDPVLVKRQAATIAAALKRIDPAHAAEYDANLSTFHAELDAMHRSFSEALAPFRGRAIVVFHPSFAYYCRRYGIEQMVIETEGKEPGAKRLAELIEQARAVSAKTIFAQVEYSPASAQAVAEAIGGRVVRLAPMAPDWPENMQNMTSAIVEALKQTPVRTGAVEAAADE